mmetsp:Transcript_32730/g.91661  ORF Transcript_32730/g.91661 Transcript_32730/m.91661 type:complete len:228 (-) Transcript_32730:662-1345(-)
MLANGRWQTRWDGRIFPTYPFPRTVVSAKKAREVTPRPPTELPFRAGPSSPLASRCSRAGSPLPQFPLRPHAHYASPHPRSPSPCAGPRASPPKFAAQSRRIIRQRPCSVAGEQPRQARMGLAFSMFPSVLCQHPGLPVFPPSALGGASPLISWRSQYTPPVAGQYTRCIKTSFEVLSPDYDFPPLSYCARNRVLFLVSRQALAPTPQEYVPSDRSHLSKPLTSTVF